MITSHVLVPLCRKTFGVLRNRILSALILASAVLLPIASVRAATYTWTGQSGSGSNWDSSANWQGPAAFPGATDIAFFSFPAPITDISLNGDQDILSLDFTNAGFNFSIFEEFLGDTLTIHGGDLNANGGTSPRSHLLEHKVVLGSDGVWDIGTTFGGPHQIEVRGRLTGRKLQKDGAGQLLLIGGTDADPSILRTLRSVGGEIIIDSSRFDLTSTDRNQFTGAMNTDGGDITLRNGADVQMSLAADVVAIINNGTLTVTGSGTSLFGKRLDAAETAGDVGSIVVEDDASVILDSFLVIGFFGDGDLTVQTGGDISAKNIDIGIDNSGTSTALVTGSGSSLAASQDLELGGQSASILGGTGELTISDGGSVQVGGQTNFYTSTSSITVNGGTLETGKLFEHTGVTGSISISDPAGGPALIVGTNNGSSTFTGLIQDAAGGPGSLRKEGTGTLTLSGANTYSGGTAINGGEVAASSDANLGDSAGPLSFSGGTLRFDAEFDLAGTRAITLNSGGGTFNTKSFTTSVSQNITGSGLLTKTGDGTLTLTGVNTYSGGTQINNGTLQLGDGTTSGSIVGDVINNGSLVFSRTNNVTFGGVISGSGSVEKFYGNTLTLTGGNTYEGGTTIDNGTLLANNTTGSATGTGTVQVNANGTLGGTGSVSGNVNASGGTLAPGASVGTLSAGSVNLDSNSTFAVELAGSGGVAGVDFDQLVVSNDATLGGTLDVSLISLFTPILGQSFEIIDVGGSLTSTFNGLAQGALVGNFGGTDLFIDYTSGDGNDVSLVASTAGDFNLDFNVDGFDFLAWQRGFGDIYDSADLADWEDNFGTAAPLSAVAVATTAVPEPATGIMLLLGMVTVLADRRKARSKLNTV